MRFSLFLATVLFLMFFAWSLDTSLYSWILWVLANSINSTSDVFRILTSIALFLYHLFLSTRTSLQRLDDSMDICIGVQIVARSIHHTKQSSQWRIQVFLYCPSPLLNMFGKDTRILVCSLPLIDDSDTLTCLGNN